MGNLQQLIQYTQTKALASMFHFDRHGCDTKYPAIGLVCDQRILAQAGLTGGSTTSPVREAVKVPVGLVEGVLDNIIPFGVGLGLLLLAAGLACIFVALAFITRIMRELVAGQVERAMNRAIAAGGALINTIFIGHYKDMARGHFIVRRLEKIHGAEPVRDAYRRL